MAEEQAPQSRTNFQLTPNGLLIQHELLPGVILQTGIGKGDLSVICNQWQVMDKVPQKPNPPIALAVPNRRARRRS